MTRLSLLLLVAACSASPGARSIDAARQPGDPAACRAARDDALDRSCGSAADCAVVASEDCCGEIDIAVHAGTEAAFPPVEATFASCLACPPVGCAHQIEDEAGEPAGAGESIVAACVASRCTTAVR